ncbi:fumarylacetoacetate hydrolase family protein [Leptodontidium sp. 2 PMI_412]|nr:fumarylacetoacetate hydrolase family protein [Leptodontidium sp. 2 PMI_412]
MFASHFSIANIPYGIASSAAHPAKSPATRIEDTVVFLDGLAKNGLLSSLPSEVVQAFSESTLNTFASLPKTTQKQTRALLQDILKPSKDLPSGSTASIQDVTMHLPVAIGDFTDFSCSKEHVLNAGEAIMKKRFLPPGFLHFPVGYTGRTSSIIPSGTPVTRPRGQFRNAQGEVVYGPTEQLDYELEVGCIVGKPSALGDSIAVGDADEHIFGLVLLNDWSARDIQGLEMMPLGPLNGKSFSTSISPWVITLDALEIFQSPAPERELKVAPYLADTKTDNTYSIQLKAELIVDDYATTICKSQLKTMYWSFRDLLAHQTSNGCNLNTGDLLATGTISGETHDSHGCLLELTKGGEQSFNIADGSRRKFLEDGDSIRISAICGEGVGFGECIGKVLPAR